MSKNLAIGGFSLGYVYEKVMAMNSHVPGSFAWHSSLRGSEVFLYVRGNHFVHLESEQYVVVALGHLSNRAGDVGEIVLKKIEGDLHSNDLVFVKDLEGSFSLIIANKSTKTIMIYRNICGVPNIYYVNSRRQTLFSDNLSYLAWVISNTSNERLVVDDSQLPYYFLYTRCFGKTLFRGIQSVLPGEQVRISQRGVSTLQRMDISDMIGPRINDCEEALEHEMTKIMAEYSATYPDIVNIFSGGVDSSYVQAHMSRLIDRTIRTFSLALSIPSRTWQAEYDYARSGSKFFESDHTFVWMKPQEYPDLLIRSILELGRPPTTQGAATVKLWEAVKKISSTALMGVAADTLFGMTQELAYVDRAIVYEKLIPFKPVRMMLPRIIESSPFRTKWREKQARFLKSSTRALILDLHNTMSQTHPLNLTEPVLLEASTKLFGHTKIIDAINERQAQIRNFHIQGSLKERLHSFLLLDVGLLDGEELYELASYVGLRLVFPFLDSRMIKAALSMRDARFSFGTSKKVIKSALRKYLPKKLVYRRKTAWGLPVPEWMGPGGVLHPLLQEANNEPMIMRESGEGTKPTAFDWVLLCFNLWHRLFIQHQRAPKQFGS
jgi:asparagine synthetase B (glutamine-hydrolysing)